MATDSDYAVGSAAAVTVLQSDLNTLVPDWARGMIPPDEANTLATPLAKTIIDAVDANRAKEQS